MPLTSETRLGTYEIVGALGAGGMGEVYRAKDVRPEVALKVLPETFACDADHLARFEREARTVAGLNHPIIVTLSWEWPIRGWASTTRRWRACGERTN